MIETIRYRNIRALRNGETLKIAGIKYKMDTDENGAEKEIRAGDLYIAERNTGPQLLTAAKVVKPGEGRNGFGNWITPTTPNYAYDIPECVKVVEAK